MLIGPIYAGRRSNGEDEMESEIKADRRTVDSGALQAATLSWVWVQMLLLLLKEVAGASLRVR